MSVREGITSDSPLVEQFDWPRDEKKPGKDLVTALASGFYVSFRGVFDESTRFSIVYTAFSYMGESERPITLVSKPSFRNIVSTSISDCFTGPEFLCANHRCIPFYLQCDGFDHCGDGSDESISCTPESGNSHAEEASEDQIHRWVLFQFFRNRCASPLVQAHAELFLPESGTLSGFEDGHHCIFRQHHGSADADFLSGGRFVSHGPPCARATRTAKPITNHQRNIG